MEALCWRHLRSALPVALVLLWIAVAPTHLLAAGYETENFTVDAPDARLARLIGDSAEKWRRQLAVEWLGAEMPQWSQKCPIKARVAPGLGAGGETSFVFDRGEVFGWRMKIQGSQERILDSVLPHEITHTVFATHFRRPLPRWADEGACTTVEHRSEIAKQERMLIQFLKTRRGIPFSSMFAMKEYPRDVLPLYAQGHSLARFLIGQRGKRAFLEFLADGMETEHWPNAVRAHYGYANLLQLQNSWMSWIRQGRPQIQPRGDVLLASSAQPRTRPETAPTPASSSPAVRGQDPQSVAESNSPRSRQAVSWPSDNRVAARSTDNSVRGGAASVYDASRNGAVMRR